MFCYTLRYVHSSIAIILMGKRELVALLNLSSWCLLMGLFLAVPWGCLRFVIVVFPDHTHYFQYLVHFQQSYTFKGALSWYGKLTWESAHAWNLIILCLFRVHTCQGNVSEI